MARRTRFSATRIDAARGDSPHRDLGAPEERTTVAERRFTRSGDTIVVAHGGTRREWFVLDDGGRTLRTVASGGCDAPHGAACIDVLNVSGYERID